MSAAAIKYVKCERPAGLLLSDKLVLGAIAFLMEDGKTSCVRSRRDISIEAGVSLPTAKRALKRLVDKRVIHRSERSQAHGCCAPSDIQIVGFGDAPQAGSGRLQGWDQDEPLRDHDDPRGGVTMIPGVGSGRSPLYKEEQKRTEETEEKKEIRVADAREQTLQLIPLKTSSADPLEAFSSYNQAAQEIGLSIAGTMTPGRRKSINARLREHGSESWSTVLANLRASPFLQGKNDRGWRPNLDWIIKPANYAKILEGNYASPTSEVKPDRTNMVFQPSRWGPGKWVPKAMEAVQ